VSVVCFLNNRLGLRALELLVARGETVAGLVLHPESRRRFGDEMIAAARVPPSAVFDGERLSDAAIVDGIRRLGADIGLSVMFGYKLRPDVFGLFPKGCFNLHPSLLPFGRGTDPNAWALIAGEPAGTTLHWIDAGIDTGDIVGQRRVAVEPTDTGKTLYRRLEDESLKLLDACWPAIAAGQAPRLPQQGTGSRHKRADLKDAERIDLDASYTGRELIDRLRALTFPPHPSAYFDVDGRRVRVRVELTEEPPDGER
jgi:methionyl-tRNA formyltransferase